MKPTYVYAARLDRVIDGDTVVAWIDLGFHTWSKASVRLLGINCPELGTAAGTAAREFTRTAFASKAAHGTDFVVESVKVDKYGGRFDGRVWLSDSYCLNDELVKAGQAVRVNWSQP